MASKIALTAASLCGFSALVIMSPVCLAAVRAVALRGDQAPGLPAGETFLDELSTPTININGHVAFLAYTQVGGSPTHSGIWTDRNGSLQLFALGETAAPGASPNNYVPASSHINDSGKIAFEGTLSGGNVDNSNDFGLWSDGSGSIAKIVRTGDAAPGMPSRVFSPSMHRPLFNDAGHAVVFSALANTSLPSGTPQSREQGLWSNRTGALQKVVALGDSAPGTGGTFNIFSSEFLQSFAAFDNHGEIAFSASTNTNLSAAGVWISRGAGIGPVGQLDFVAGPGSSTNGVLPGVTFSYALLAGLNDAKQVGLQVTLQGSGVTSQNDRSLWRSSNGNVSLIAREGQAIAGTGLTIHPSSVASFTSLSMNDKGMMVFSTKVDDASGSRSGIFTADENGIYLKALGGQQAPGVPSGVFFNNFIGDFGNVAINGEGQVAFLANLTGPGINSTNDQGLWATDRDGVLKLIVRERDPIEYLPGQFGTVSSFSSWVSSGDQDGTITSFNDQGQITFSARGSNFGWGIFVSDVASVPEPSTLLLAALALLGIGKTSWRAGFFNS